MDLLSWQPYRGLDRLRSTWDQVFADHLANLDDAMASWRIRFPVEVVERGQDIVVRAELAGIDPADVDVRVTDDGLTLRGERKRQADEEKDGVRHSERFYGSFSRTIAFPAPVDSGRATATFRHGLLEITAPRRADDGRGGRKLSIDAH